MCFRLSACKFSGLPDFNCSKRSQGLRANCAHADIITAKLSISKCAKLLPLFNILHLKCLGTNLPEQELELGRQ